MQPAPRNGSGHLRRQAQARYSGIVEQFRRILVRATNWVGDAILSLPAVEAVRRRWPQAQIAILARPWVADIYRFGDFADEILLYEKKPGIGGLKERLRVARMLRQRGFDCALLLQNAFDAALLAWLAGIPRRIGYARDARRLLLTDAVPVPGRGEIPRHESFYYLELLRRIGWIEHLPARADARLRGVGYDPQPLVGVSPGAAFGSAKRWLPERFAEAAATVAARLEAEVEVFGSGAERGLCEQVAEAVRARGVAARNRAGETTLAEFIRRAAQCRVFLTNDSGAMHIAAVLGVPTVAVFGSTDPEATAPLGSWTRIVREPVECSPCLLRECPIDHRCMRRVAADRVAAAALELVECWESARRGC
ncbi:MAG: lipopolysaccharide heptosyltransferase II [Bryobacteraceae bacterium]|nr:lipopolysaccharide heptosyltransferase II [Bryobacteraceae bacterium]